MLLALVVLAAGCSSDKPETQERKPQQEGEPVPALQTAANIAKARVAVATGRQQDAQQAVRAITEDFRKSIKLVDPARPVDREQARSAAKRVPAVRSVVWLDATNLFAIVETNEHRSQATIDDICMELEPLGDTLGVVVNLQSGAATNGDELEIMQRNCQLAPGQHALLRRPRKVDVIDPAIRAQHKANNGR